MFSLGILKERKHHLFKVSLKADSKTANIFLKDSGFYEKYLQEKPELHMQLRYENGTLCVVTGIYNSSFTLDKSVENAWDMAVQRGLWHYHRVN